MESLQNQNSQKISFQIIKKNSKYLDLIHVNIGDLKLMKTRSRKIIPLYIQIIALLDFPKEY